MPRLNPRELATVLAALRYWQDEMSTSGANDCYPEHFAGGIVPLAADEIDGLCERLNAIQEVQPGP